MRRIILILLIVVVAVGAGLVTLSVMRLNRPVEPYGEEVSFSIRKGEALATIAGRLNHLGLIRAGALMRAIAWLKGTEGSFQSGTFRISPAMSSSTIHDILVFGTQALQKVTIPEGWPLRKIALRLEQNGITPAGDFIAAVADPELLANFGIPGANAEGYLYPETYLFPHNYPAQGVAQQMILTFFEALDNIHHDWRSLSAEELHHIVILASIVEREYVAANEAPAIASVFYNRLETGMRLESCATVVYVMTEEQGLPHPNRLFYHDLYSDSPYNTYTNFGLPPGPIANPSRVALESAFYPAETNYRFFVLKGYDANRHFFSEDLAEHHRASIYYLKNP